MGSHRGQSESLSVGLLFAITIIGAITIVVFGSMAIADTQHSAEVNHAQQSMTQFDSTASTVALGGSSVKSVSFGGSAGTYNVEPTAGHITITHLDYDGSSDEIVYENDLGSVVYRNGDRLVAYQGGGVWSKSEGGESKMVSPPEFHYRGATLTLPVVRVSGSGGVQGNPTATVSQVTSGKPVYPASSSTNPRAPYDATGGPYINPQEEGKFQVTVRSRYYEAWGNYFDQRTAGTTTLNHNPAGAPDGVGEVTVVLESLGVGSGPFDLPNEGGVIPLRGLGADHAITDFTLRLEEPSGTNADFNNMQWALTAEEGQKQFELYLKDGGTGGTCGGSIDAVIYYSDDGGTTYHGWYGDDVFTVQCDGTDPYLVVDFTSTSQMTYQSLSSSDSLSGEPPKPSQGTLHTGSPTIDGSHASHSSRTYAAGSGTEEMGFLVSHYIAKFDSSLDLEVNDKSGNGGSVNEGPSSGEIHYGGSGQYVTFLHVTDNEIEVNVN